MDFKSIDSNWLARVLYREHCDAEGWFHDDWDDEPEVVHELYREKAQAYIDGGYDL